jgi:hypothetical protein
MNNEVERFGRKQPWRNFSVLSLHPPEGNEKNHEKLSQDSWSPGHDLIPGPPEYKAFSSTYKSKRRHYP